jgi:hypothetical protein
MKLEYLSSGSTDCPLIRLFSFTPHEAVGLMSAVAALAAGESSEFEVHAMQGVEALEGCRLTLRASGHDAAVVRLPGPANFECVFRPEEWDNVAALIRPFTQSSHGYAWLADLPGEARVLLSPTGDW